MEYENLDSILIPWSKSNGLFLSKEFKDTPVRSWSVVDVSGNEFQLWLEIRENEFLIHASVYKSRKWTEQAGFENLQESLSKGLSEIERWMGDKKPNRVIKN